MIQELLQIRQDKPLRIYHSTKEWASDYYESTKNKTPIEKAIWGGFLCQQFSFAFMAGYQAALEQMFPTIAPNELKALCVSETGGGHPKAIETTLINHQVDGLKTYVTTGSDVAHLLVLCKTDKQVGTKPLLKIVHIPKSTNNVSITDFKLPFMIDVKHGKATFKNVNITPNQILEGDGYTLYTKPFRTLESICVGAAYQSMILRQAIENSWNQDLRDNILLNIHTLKSLIYSTLSEQEKILLLTRHEQNFELLLPEIESNVDQSPIFKTDWNKNKKIISDYNELQ